MSEWNNKFLPVISELMRVYRDYRVLFSDASIANQPLVVKDAGFLKPFQNYLFDFIDSFR